MRSLIPCLAALSLVSGCFLFGDKSVKAVQGADALLVAGDIPGGIAAYQAAAKDFPDSVDAAVGAAYGAYLVGDFAGADKLLAGVEGKVPERKGEVVLRRALVALAMGELDSVRSLGEASGLPAGKMLAAEVALADGERDKATELLNAARTDPGEVGVTAGQYLALLQDPDPRVQGLSEAQALWALGQRKVAVRSVEEIVKSIPEEREDKADILLLWAGRAASAGEPQIASNLVESIGLAPAGQQWRVIATRGIIACAEGDGPRCRSVMDGLEAAAPPEGLRDARATAAILLAEKDPGAAVEVLGSSQSAAAARAFLAAGDTASARRAVTAGPLSKYLTGSGG